MMNTCYATTADEMMALLTADGREFEVERYDGIEDLYVGWTTIAVCFDDNGMDVREYTYYDDGDFEYEQLGWNGCDG